MVGRHAARRRGVRGAAPALLAGLCLLLAPASVHAAAPSNDDRTGALPIALLGSGTFDLTEATIAADDPAPCLGAGPTQGSVWFAYIALETRPVVIAFTGDGSTAVHVLDADGSTEVGCAVTSDATHIAPHVDLDAQVGETYLIAVTGVTAPGPTGYVVIEPQLVVTLETVTTGQVTAGGDVLVSYHFSCSQDLQLEPELDLSQGSGSSQAIGGTLTSDNCFAPTTTIEMVATHGSGANPDARFRNGQAQAYIQFNAMTFAQVYRSTAETKVIELTGGPTVTTPPTDAAAVSAVGSEQDGASIVPWLFGIALAVLGLLTWTGLRRPRFRRA